MPFIKWYLVKPIITLGVELFHDCPAPIMKPGQANTICPSAGWLLQWAVTLKQLEPPSLIAALAAAYPLFNVVFGEPEKLLHEQVPVQMPRLHPAWANGDK